MQYDEEWVMSRRNRYHGLAPLRNALHEAGDPDRQLRIIHVAGTNGKGSTVQFLSDILRSQGHRTGTFTSPHLMNHRDRIRIDGGWIPHDVFCAYLERYAELIKKYDLGMFEIDCLAAFVWFAEEHVSYAVIEAGLGGRLDNTNVITKSELSVIATIGKDHTQVLGERIQQIAFEKAGIIKENGHAVISTDDPHARNIIRRHASRIHAAVSVPKPVYPAGSGMFRYDGDLYAIASKAEYQIRNAALALAAARLLGIDIHSAAVHEAVAASTWPGRFEAVINDPLTILDGAHNEEGVTALARSLASLPSPRVIVFSALSDKPFLRMLAILQGCAEEIIVTTFRDERAADFSACVKQGYPVLPDYREAIIEARRRAGVSGTVIITGSLHFISAVREYLTPLG
ncbi:MAG: bifunctional folylpolyglutamate synthase/dihydrofolate synthase [Solobacterium sp.]|nr:bifunctional folylpolyglutamate synthase/dihydrofolate synthase [Solobacterium sp.]